MTRSVRLCLITTLIYATIWIISTETLVGQGPQKEVDANETDTSIEKRQARVFLRLQEAILQQSEALNSRIANTVSIEDVNELKLNVALAKQLFENAQNGETRNRRSVYFRLAQNAAVSAESELTKAIEVRKKLPSAYTDLDIEILQLKMELAGINIAVGEKALDGSPDDELRWKADQLYEEIFRLRNEVRQLRRRR